MSEIKPKKMVRRSVAIALGIICIILGVSLIGVIEVISILNGENASLNLQVTDLTDTLNLGKSILLVGHSGYPLITYPSGYESWHFPQNLFEIDQPEVTINQTGYISVKVQSPTNNTYVRVVYSYQGKDNQTLNYDNQINVSKDEVLVFPVLPTLSLEIRVGNTSPLNGTGGSVILGPITYVY